MLERPPSPRRQQQQQPQPQQQEDEEEEEEEQQQLLQLAPLVLGRDTSADDVCAWLIRAGFSRFAGLFDGAGVCGADLLAGGTFDELVTGDLQALVPELHDAAAQRIVRAMREAASKRAAGQRRLLLGKKGEVYVPRRLSMVGNSGSD